MALELEVIAVRGEGATQALALNLPPLAVYSFFFVKNRKHADNLLSLSLFLCIAARASDYILPFFLFSFFFLFPLLFSLFFFFFPWLLLHATHTTM